MDSAYLAGIPDQLGMQLSIMDTGFIKNILVMKKRIAFQLFPLNGWSDIKIGSVSGAWVKWPPFSSRAQAMAGKAQKTLSFESAMAELEQLVADMEGGKLSLEDSLTAYKRGAELLSFCRSRLDDAQQQVRVLEEGVLKDFSTGSDA